MITLFIDTHSNYLQLVLLKNYIFFDVLKLDASNSHSKITLSSICDLLDRNSLTVKDLNSLIVVNGPGSFTGIRIGMSIAKTLAYTLNIPIKQVSYLDLMLQTSKSTNKIAMIKDNKGYYLAIYNKDSCSYKYLSNQEYADLDKDAYDLIVDENLDFNLLDIYFASVKALDVHQIKPFYIKKIEVEK